MGEGEDTSRISRRRLLQRLGLGTAVATFTPIVTSLGSEALAGPCPPCEPPCNWTCGGQLQQCGLGCGPFGAAYCSADTEGNCFCWEDTLCSEVQDCASTADCPPGYACIPNTCCGVPKCLAGCGLGRRPRRRHGKRASGKVA
jgi:hypothetical protein